MKELDRDSRQSKREQKVRLKNVVNEYSSKVSRIVKKWVNIRRAKKTMNEDTHWDDRIRGAKVSGVVAPPLSCAGRSAATGVRTWIRVPWLYFALLSFDVLCFTRICPAFSCSALLCPARPGPAMPCRVSPR